MQRASDMIPACGAGECGLHLSPWPSPPRGIVGRLPFAWAPSQGHAHAAREQVHVRATHHREQIVV
eukprot:6695945-Heterocapsa_arctica.AAC.1